MRHRERERKRRRAKERDPKRTNPANHAAFALLTTFYFIFIFCFDFPLFEIPVTLLYFTHTKPGPVSGFLAHWMEETNERNAMDEWLMLLVGIIWGFGVWEGIVGSDGEATAQKA